MARGGQTRFVIIPDRRPHAAERNARVPAGLG